MVSGIDIDRFSSDQLGIVSRQDRGRDADVFDADKLSRRCAFGGEFEQIIETFGEYKQRVSAATSQVSIHSWL